MYSELFTEQLPDFRCAKVVYWETQEQNSSVNSAFGMLWEYLRVDMGIELKFVYTTLKERLPGHAHAWVKVSQLDRERTASGGENCR